MSHNGVPRPSMGLDFVQTCNRFAIFLCLELSHRLAELLRRQRVLALFENSPAPHADKQQGGDRNANVNYNAVLLIGFKDVFGGGLKPIGLSEFLASQSLAGRRHYFAGNGSRNSPRAVALARNYCLYLKSSGPIFSRISAHF